MKIYRRNGFTLIELMVVIAIISILATFSVPSFEKHIAKANLVDVQLYASRLTGSIDEFTLTHSTFPTTNEFDGFKPDHSNIELIKSVSLSKLDATQGNISIAFNTDIGIQENEFIKYSRTTDGQWLCESSLSTSISPEHCSEAE